MLSQLEMKQAMMREGNERWGKDMEMSGGGGGGGGDEDTDLSTLTIWS